MDTSLLATATVHVHPHARVPRSPASPGNRQIFPGAEGATATSPTAGGRLEALPGGTAREFIPMSPRHRPRPLVRCVGAAANGGPCPRPASRHRIPQHLLQLSGYGARQRGSPEHTLVVGHDKCRVCNTCYRFVTRCAGRATQNHKRCKTGPCRSHMTRLCAFNLPPDIAFKFANFPHADPDHAAPTRPCNHAMGVSAAQAPAPAPSPGALAVSAATSPMSGQMRADVSPESTLAVSDATATNVDTPALSAYHSGGGDSVSLTETAAQALASLHELGLPAQATWTPAATCDLPAGGGSYYGYPGPHPPMDTRFGYEADVDMERECRSGVSGDQSQHSKMVEDMQQLVWGGRQPQAF